MERLAIVGVGQTAFSENKSKETFADLVYQATQAALTDAALEIKDIDNIITVSNDFWDGRTISSMAIGDAAGAAYANGKNTSTVEGDGSQGAFYGASRILSGSYQTTLVVAHAKPSEGSPCLITNAFYDPIFERPLGMNQTTACAMAAQAYCRRHKITAQQTAGVVVKNRANACKNPYAYLRRQATLQEVVDSPYLAAPIKTLEAAPYCDGAAAIILASEAWVRRRAAKRVWVRGIGLSAEEYRLGERTLSEAAALTQAAQQAYRMAGISRPSEEIHVAEISELYSYQELLWSEALGFCGQGQGGQFFESGATSVTGELPVNPSGGCLSAHTPVVAGLVRLIETTLQLRGDAANQVTRNEIGLAHGQHGLAGQSHCVWILSKN